MIVVDCDSKKYCPLVKREIRRGYCYEIEEVRRDNMDIEHIEDRFDVEKANKICKQCQWDSTAIG